MRDERTAKIELLSQLKLEAAFRNKNFLIENCMNIRIYSNICLVFIGPRCPWGQIYGSEFHSLSEPRFADLTENANSISTDYANRALQGDVAMRVTQPGGQLWNQAMQVKLPDDQILN